MDEDKLETIVDKHNLDMDIDDVEGIKAQRILVLEKLEAEGLLLE